LLLQPGAVYAPAVQLITTDYSRALKGHIVTQLPRSSMLAAQSRWNCSSRLGQSHQPVLRHCKLRINTSLRPSTRILAAAGAQEQPHQPNDAQQQQLSQPAAAAATLEAQQAVEQSSKQLAAVGVAEHAEVADSSAQTQQQSSSSHAAATSMYLALAGGLAVAGLLVATFAAPIAASRLSLGNLQLQQAAALVGCGGAALLRAASLAVFVAVSAEPWRFSAYSHAVRVMACAR
jgi:hypothetical protein